MIKDNYTNYVLYRIGKSGNHIEILSIPYNKVDRDYKFLCAQERADLLNEKLWPWPNLLNFARSKQADFAMKGYG